MPGAAAPGKLPSKLHPLPKPNPPQCLWRLAVSTMGISVSLTKLVSR